MTVSDGKELRRIGEMLRSVEGTLGGNSPLRKALRKAGIALGPGGGVHDGSERNPTGFTTAATDASEAGLQSASDGPDAPTGPIDIPWVKAALFH